MKQTVVKIVLQMQVLINKFNRLYFIVVNTVVIGDSYVLMETKIIKTLKLSICNVFGVEYRNEYKCARVLSGQIPGRQMLKQLIEYAKKFAKHVKKECKVHVKIHKSGGSVAFIDELTVAGIDPQDAVFTETETGGTTIDDTIFVENGHDTFESCLSQALFNSNTIPKIILFLLFILNLLRFGLY